MVYNYNSKCTRIIWNIVGVDFSHLFLCHSFTILVNLLLDKLSVQYQLQLDLIQEQEVKIGKSFSYLVKEKGGLKSYKFVVDSIEKIDTALGNLRTFRMIREREQENRSTILWLAPKYKYTLVKMIQREKGKVWELDIKNWSKKRKVFF